MNKLKTSRFIGLLLTVTWVLFALTDMWFDVVTTGIFIKISISAFALFLMILLLDFFFSKPDNSKPDN